MPAREGHTAFLLPEFIDRHRLPAAFAATATQFLVPLANWVQQQVSVRQRDTFVLGINGAQGAGKSTVAAFLAEYLRAEHGYHVAALSIDDIYLSKADRQGLARDVHPLLATRGVPGTHDPALGQLTITRLRELTAGETIRLPRFDKLRDDRCPADEWPTVAGCIDVVLFEGWCVGSQAVAEQTLAEPVNELERHADANGEWRRLVNAKLADEYHALFALLDALVFLAVPDFDCVLSWRTEQEHKLHDAADRGTGQPMTDAQVGQFVQYFERITLQNLALLPQRADVVLWLGQDHQVGAADYRNKWGQSKNGPNN